MKDAKGHITILQILTVIGIIFIGIFMYLLYITHDITFMFAGIGLSGIVIYRTQVAGVLL